MTVPAVPLRPGTPAAATGLKMRAWKESGKTRVVVWAVSSRSRRSAVETQIATFLLADGESRDVVETEDVGAAHVFVSFERK